MSRTSSDFDIALGARVRVRRKEIGLSQAKLGDALGVTFQQVQKYEKGRNRIPAKSVFELSGALGVPITYFFPDVGEDGRRLQPADSFELLNLPGALRLLRDFSRVENASVRRSLCNMARSLANAEIRPQA